MTVKELLEYCKAQVKKGNGDKKIYLSDDDEGNGFHEMFFAFSVIDEEHDVKDWEESLNTKVGNRKEFMESLYNGIDYKDMKNSIILG